MQRSLAVAITVAVLAGNGCAIDFDAPFAETLEDGGVLDGSGGSGGTAGASGSGGVAGAAGAAGAAGIGGTAGTAGSGGTAGDAGTGATGGTSGTGGTGGTQTGGTGGSGPLKSCDNGIDDDGDGLVDCEDPDCQAAGYTCMPEVPSGWSGPLILRTDPNGTPSCEGSWNNVFATGGLEFSILSGGTCPSCSCATSTNARCGLDVVLFDQVKCAGNSETSVFEATGTCVNVGMQSFEPLSVRATSTYYVVSGNCTPSSTGTPSIPPAEWTLHGRACQATAIGGGCEANLFCSPPSSTGLVCIARNGQHSCPQEFSNSEMVLFRDLTDGRSCTACTCGSPTGTCSGAEISAEDPMGGCAGQGTVIHPNGPCVDLDLHPTYSTFALQSWLPSGINATCTPSTSEITGSVVGSSPLTLCCRSSL